MYMSKYKLQFGQSKRIDILICRQRWRKVKLEFFPTNYIQEFDLDIEFDPNGQAIQAKSVHSILCSVGEDWEVQSSCLKQCSNDFSKHPGNCIQIFYWECATL